MERPFFSCVIPVKGARPYFDEALESLRIQGLSYEIIGSTPTPNTNTSELEIIVQDGDVEPDGGQSDALNRGFAKARGEWLFWLNADDVLLPGALRKVAEAAHAASCDSAASGCRSSWIAGNMVVIDSGGRVVSCRRDGGSRRLYSGRPIRVYGPSSFFRRSLFESVGGIDASLKYSMDTDLWMRFRETGHWFVKLPDYLWGFRMHPGSKTMSGVLDEALQDCQDCEVFGMEARHGVHMNRFDARFVQAWRWLDGSYLLGLFHTLRNRGKNWRDVTC